MANIQKWLQEVVAKYGEPLEAVVISPKYNEGKSPEQSDINVLSPAAALARLDEEFDDGFAGSYTSKVFPIYAWTASRVFFIEEYDGSTRLKWVPRHPIEMSPTFNGERGSSPDQD